MRVKVLTVLCFLSLLSLAAPLRVYAGMEAVASEGAYFEPFWDNTARISVSLTFNNNGRATMSGSVIGYPGTTSITVDAVLERVNSNGTFTRVASFNSIRAEGNIWLWERPHYGSTAPR